ncbi:MAG TPA: hypothetical protein PK413_15490 [Thermoanaerobaculia bacterium]|mgnify:CR=1 FL=1|nr:hypothetical protein [Thermoanaerobaculia bacterium]
MRHKLTCLVLVASIALALAGSAEARPRTHAGPVASLAEEVVFAFESLAARVVAWLEKTGGAMDPDGRSKASSTPGAQGNG